MNKAKRKKPTQTTSKRAREWLKANPWFGVDEDRTAAALLLHQQIVDRGVEAESDEYWEQIQIGTDPTPDLVNHPPHYKAGGVETIDFILAKNLGFCLGNVVKYISRAGIKSHNPLEDLKKAQWYLNKEVARLEGTK
jgi:Protein of unknwon function (DUF3310)